MGQHAIGDVGYPVCLRCSMTRIEGTGGLVPEQCILTQTIGLGGKVADTVVGV